MVAEQPTKEDLTDIYKEEIAGYLKQIDDKHFIKKLYYLILAYRNRVGL